MKRFWPGWLIMLILILVVAGCRWFQPAPKPMPDENRTAAGVMLGGRPAGQLAAAEIRTLLDGLASETNRQAKSARFNVNGAIIPEENGQALDHAATMDKLFAAAPYSEVQPVYQTVYPAVTRDRLTGSRIVGRYQTAIIDDAPGRVHNIRLTADMINNAVLGPGQEFSFNKLTGEPTRERGFEDAGVLLHGQKVPGVGGGMCQVSSTIYNAVLATGLPVTERHSHSVPISYVPPGRDATTYTDKDFRFVNNTGEDLVLRVLTDGRQVSVEILALPG